MVGFLLLTVLQKVQDASDFVICYLLPKIELTRRLTETTTFKAVSAGASVSI